MSEESNKKSRDSKGRFVKGHKEGIGVKHSEKTKQKIREKRKFQIISEETKIKMSNSRKGKEIKTTFKKGCFGDKSAHWKGGITPLYKKLRNSSLYKIWKETILLRDNFICQNPNCEFCDNRIGVMLQVHHIKPFAFFPELRFVISNGITYCEEFHINSKLLHKKLKEFE